VLSLAAQPDRHSFCLKIGVESSLPEPYVALESVEFVSFAVFLARGKYIILLS